MRKSNTLQNPEGKSYIFKSILKPKFIKNNSNLVSQIRNTSEANRLVKNGNSQTTNYKASELKKNLNFIYSNSFNPFSL